MTMKKLYMRKSKTWGVVNVEETVIEMHKSGETPLNIATALQINKRWAIEILREVGRLTPTKRQISKEITFDRYLKIHAQRVGDKRTLRSVAEENGISSERVRQIVLKIERQKKRWWDTLYAKKFPDGVLVDPDGIGEFEDEWTVEEMYKNMFDMPADL